MDKIHTKQADMFDEFELETKPNNKLIKQKLVSYYNEVSKHKIIIYVIFGFNFII